MAYRVALAQIAPVLFNTAGNESRMAACIDRAASEKASLVVFPEMSLTGYSIEKDRLPQSVRTAIAHDVGASLGRLRARSARSGVDFLASYPLFEDGRAYIAAEYVERGETRAIHRKLNLCNYGHYTEHLNFSPGNAVTVVSTRLGTLGILICEDLWHPVNAALCAQMGAEVLLGPSAPCVTDPSFANANLRRWHIINAATALTQTCYVLCVTRAGMEKSVFFNGGSHVYSPDGSHLLSMPPLEESFGTVDIYPDFIAQVRRELPLLANSRNDLLGAAYTALARPKA